MAQPTTPNPNANASNTFNPVTSTVGTFTLVQDSHGNINPGGFASWGTEVGTDTSSLAAITQTGVVAINSNHITEITYQNLTSPTGQTVSDYHMVVVQNDQVIVGITQDFTTNTVSQGIVHI